MNEQVFQIVMALINTIGVLFFWSMRQEIRHVRELLEERADEQDRRIERLENKCSAVTFPCSKH